MPDTILITAAVKDEISGLAALLQNPQEKEYGGRLVRSGKIGDLPVAVVVSGPGTANTVQALSACLEHIHPWLLIQTGCAGAFSPSGLTIGDIGVADEEIDAHTGLEAEEDDSPPAPLPFPILTGANFRITNRYPFDRRLAQSAATVLGAFMEERSVRVVRGPFLSVATVTTSDRRAARLHGHYHAVMESMEGAAAAHVALHYEVPFLEIRAASNRVGQRDLSDWNLPLAFRRCCDAVSCILENYRDLETG